MEIPYFNDISKKSKSYGIIHQIRNTLDIKSKTIINNSHINPYLTYFVNVRSSTYPTNLKIVRTVKTRSECTLFATAQEPHSRDIFLTQKNLLIHKLINQQEGILAFRVINGTFMHGDILTDRHVSETSLPTYKRWKSKNYTALNDSQSIINSF